MIAHGRHYLEQRRSDPLNDLHRGGLWNHELRLSTHILGSILLITEILLLLLLNGESHMIPYLKCR